MTKTVDAVRKLFIAALLTFVGCRVAGAPAPAGDVLEKDQWMVGKLNGQPMASMHAIVVRHADGTRTMQQETTIAIVRKLGASTFRMEIRQSETLEENAGGFVTRFRLDEEQDGATVCATGRVEGDEVVATVLRLGRAAEQRLKLKDGLKLLGQQAVQERLARRSFKPGEQEKFASVALLNKSVSLATTTATFQRKRDDGNLDFEAVVDVLPVPTRMTITPSGDLVMMSMKMGLFAIDFAPADGPVPLLAAEIPLTGLVTAKGPAPKAVPENRFRVPKEAAVDLVDGAFQTVVGDVVRVRAEAAASSLTESERAELLRAEAQLEIDDLELRAWVDEVKKEVRSEDEVELAERLRLAVRSRITEKDLAKADGSALEAFRDRRGDCTEHANLLCACLRIAGIPSRGEIGLVYSADYGGWCGHAWNSAWIDGRWRHLDSAYPGIARSLYLRLGSATGLNRVGTAAAMLKAMTRMAGMDVETVTEPDR